MDFESINEYGDSIDGIWNLVDANIPHSTASLRRSRHYESKMNDVLNSCIIPVLSMATTMATLIETVDGVKFSKKHERLLRIAVLNEIICNEVMAFRDRDLCELADDDMELASNLSRLMVQENEEEEYESEGQVGDILS